MNCVDTIVFIFLCSMFNKTCTYYIERHPLRCIQCQLLRHITCQEELLTRHIRLLSKTHFW